MAKDAPKYLGGYRLHNIIHASRTCLIWQASDDRNNRLVGIKALREEFAKNREHVTSLRWEYTQSAERRSIRELSKFSVSARRKASHFLAMEWYPSPNMKYWIQQGTEKILYLIPKIIEQAAEGLGHFNEQGYVHRDVKPDNFLVGDDGEVKLIDLALAVKARRGLARLFAPRSKVQGTRSYMSPEQIRGTRLGPTGGRLQFCLHGTRVGVRQASIYGDEFQRVAQQALEVVPPVLGESGTQRDAGICQAGPAGIGEGTGKAPGVGWGVFGGISTMQGVQSHPTPPRKDYRLIIVASGRR